MNHHQGLQLNSGAEGVVSVIGIEVVARIRRLFFVEHMTVNAISTELGHHRDTIRRALATETFRGHRPRESCIDPWKDYIHETIEKYPRIRAPRLRMLLMDRGFKGSVSTVRTYIRGFRRQHRQAFLRLEHMPGEQAQVDWADFGKIKVEGGYRRLSCFVMVLAYSRQLFGRFGFDQCLESFMAGHVEAFSFLGGVPRSLLYDNLKSAVIERLDGHIRFNTNLLEMSAHYRFAPKACAPYAGNQKGRVERTIRYIRENFFEAREFSNLADLNHQFDKWRDEVANVRPWPQNHDKNILAAFAEERGILIPLPEQTIETRRILITRSGKRPYIQIDSNHYSIPHEFISISLTVRLSPEEVVIYSADAEIARHLRSMAKGTYVDDPLHRKALADDRKIHKNYGDRSVLLSRFPTASALLPLWVERGDNIGRSSQRLLALLDQYKTSDIEQAIAEAIERRSPSIDSIAYLLQKSIKTELPRTRLNLSERLSGIDIRSHDPSQYDDLTSPKEYDSNDEPE